MNEKQKDTLIDDILRIPELGAIILRQIPEFRDLENRLGPLQLTSLNMKDLMMVGYQCIGNTGDYPGVASSLQRTKTIKGKNIINKKRINIGLADEHEDIHLGFYGNRVQCVLTVYNPSYRFPK